MLKLFRKSRMNIEALAAQLGLSAMIKPARGMVTDETALSITAVFCAARVIAEGIGQMPVRVVKEEFDRASNLPRLSVARDHWAHRLLAVRPNEWQTAYEFREGMIFNAVLAGGALAIKNVVNGRVVELLPVRPNQWTVEQLSDWSLAVRVTMADGTYSRFDLSQVFYLRGPSIDGYAGLHAVRLAREAIGLSQALEAQQAELAWGGGTPSGVLSFAAALKPETKAALRKDWQASYGPGGKGGIAILDSDAKFLPLTMTSVDAQFLETRRLQIEEIARAFRVQPIMLMQADKAATFASAEQMFRNHVIHTLGPWIERFEQAANRDILGLQDGLRIDLDERNLLRGDFKDQAEYYAKALGAGGTPAWMTQNEVRVEVGLNPVDTEGANALSTGSMNQGAAVGTGA